MRRGYEKRRGSRGVAEPRKEEKKESHAETRREERIDRIDRQEQKGADADGVE